MTSQRILCSSSNHSSHNLNNTHIFAFLHSASNPLHRISAASHIPMSFSKAFTPRNASFYISESPVGGYKYRPQSADRHIFARSTAIKICRSKEGRCQSFILTGRASHPNKRYDCRGVAGSRVYQNKSNHSCLPAPGQYHVDIKHIVTQAQIKKYLNTTNPKPRLPKTVQSARKHIPSSVHKRVTVPRLTNDRKKTWFPCGDAKLLKHPGPSTYNAEKKKVMRRSSSMLIGHAMRSVSMKKPIKEPYIAKPKRVNSKPRARRSRNDSYQKKASSEGWRISRQKSFDVHTWKNSFRDE